MRICDLKAKDIKVGMKVRSCGNNKVIGEIISRKELPNLMIEFIVKWERSLFPGHISTALFRNNDAQCEIVEYLEQEQLSLPGFEL